MTFLIAYAVIFIITGVVIFNTFRTTKRNTACLDLLTINDALETFAIENKHLPDDLLALCDANNPAEKIYLEWQPFDPWGNRYMYQVNEVSGYTLKSLGADGKEGGDGEARDITIEDAKAEIQEREGG